MIALSNKKFLTLFAAMLVACSFVAVVDAEGVRRRGLKSGGKGKGKGKGNGGGTSNNARPNNFISNTINSFNPPNVAYSVDTSDWDTRCPNQESALYGCLRNNGAGDQDIDLCYTCIKGQATLNSVTAHGLNSCSNPSVNGGICNEACREIIKPYFVCGSGKSLGGVPTAGTPLSNGGTPATGTSVANPNTGDSPPVNTMELYAPITSCPFDEPMSGDPCTVPSQFRFLKCYFPNLECTCRDQEAVWLCY